MRASTEDELEPLKSLIRQGDLFAVQDWLREGKPLLPPPGSKKWSVLELAAGTGFRSMVEVLAKAWPDQPTLNQALVRALRRKRGSIARLLVEYGADAGYPRLSEVAECYDPEVMKFFLDRRADPCKDDDLAEAIVAQAKPLIGVFKDFCKGSQDRAVQLAKALKYFVEQKNERWVSLALWMGADPRLPTTSLFEERDDEPTSSLEHAYRFGGYEVAKHFKIDRQADDPTKLLGGIFELEIRLVDHLLSHGARINDKPNGGSSVLEKCLDLMWFRERCNMRGPIGEATEWGLSQLIGRGARLAPDDAEVYRTIRGMIYHMPEWGRKDFVKLLAQAAEPEAIFKILDTPIMRAHFGMRAADIMKSYRLRLPPSVAARLKEHESRARYRARHPRAGQ